MRTRTGTTYSAIAILLALASDSANIHARQEAPQITKLTTIQSFTGPNGEYPISPLMFDSSGAAFGSTGLGGSGLSGMVFRLTPPTARGDSWTESVLYSFEGGADGQQPNDLVFGPAGVLYSATDFGGSDLCYMGCGTIFELTPHAAGSGAWTQRLLYDFQGGKDGQEPGNLMLRNGSLYGVTPGGGPPAASPCNNRVGCGTVFQLTPPAAPGGSWTKTLLYVFPGRVGDGRAPNADIVFDTQGNLYGTTYYGGTSFYGTVFELTPPAQPGGTWTETVLHNFTGGSDGGYPIGGLTLGPNGSLYGTASYSGVANDSGTAFELTPPAVAGGAWTYTVLHTFPANSQDGATPASIMTLDPDGNLYGTTWNGGSTACYLGCGTVFKLAPPASPGGAWSETVLHAWPDSGQVPNVSIVVFKKGLLYGTTEFLGADDVGSAFTLVP